MLDVILTILSILGIILLVLLGIILAVLLIVLFFPISYKAEGWKREDGFLVEAKVNWLFRLIRVRAAFPEPGNVVVKALWFTLFDSKAEKKEKNTSADAKVKRAKKDRAGKFVGKKTKDSGDGVTGATGKAEAEKAETERTIAEKTVAEKTVAENAMSGATETSGDKAIEGSALEKQTSEKAAQGAATDIGTDSSAHISQDGATEGQEPEEKPGLLQKLTEKKEKIKFKILNIYGKIKYIWENITFYKDLLKEEQTQALLKHLGLRLKKIIWSIRPRKINADIVFGASSPDTTGYCMAVYGILSPVLGKRVRFTPDFEQAVFKGEFVLSGHITLFTIVMNACIFALDKKLRLLIAKVKKFYNKQNSQNEKPKQEAKGKDGGDETAA